MSARARDAVVFAIFFRAPFGVHRSLRARCSAGILGSNILTMGRHYWWWSGMQDHHIYFPTVVANVGPPVGAVGPTISTLKWMAYGLALIALVEIAAKMWQVSLN